LSSHDDLEPDAAETEDDPVAPPSSEKPVIREPAMSDLLRLEGRVPAEWQMDGAILCIAGRGPLDEAAAEMFAQLLGKHGLGTRILPHEAVGRTSVLDLDVKGVQMIALCYVEISGTPAHLRYLVRRIRKQAPEATILVGVWQADHAVFRDEGVRASVGADHSASSLRNGVVRSLQVATGETNVSPVDVGNVTPMPQHRNGNGNAVRRLRRPA
jgi:hypothetical protein